MLSDKKLKAFVSTTDRQKAKLFYKDTLGLKLISEDDYALEFDANDAPLRVSVVEKLNPQPFTVLGWDVDDITSTIKSLNEKGISFERYEFMQQDELGIWTSPGGSKVTWFKDPDGNILSLSQ
jgi:catechol 2,3-dioxygenase-like lactoylglutathione lyase family enzyme